MSIRVLDPEVVNQIAAGEVLERPANLIKELVENSLDAGATRIELEFDLGGREVVLQDDGRGMSRQDLPLALMPHATSKITASGDIYRLRSFGFRGEALASIAAVSQLTLTSRTADSEAAYRISAEHGQAGAPVEISAPFGTEVRVRELFANVPARLRFMKSETSEASQIKTALKALALANPGVAFRVRHKNSLLFHWPAQAEFAKRAQDVLGTGTLYYGTYSHEGVSAEVLVSSPKDTNKLNRNLWFFVQGRWVQDRALGAAVMEGYRNLLMHGEYPTAIIRLTCAPEEVDVNVHPTKAQVRFRDPSLAFRAVCRAIRGVLEEAPWLGPAAVAPSFALTPTSEEPVTLKFASPDFSRVQYQSKTFPLAEVRAAVGSLVEPEEFVPETTSFRWSDLHVIGQLNQTYIVAQTGDRMYLVDQHAAHERVVFERLLRDFQMGRIEVQNLLLPLVFDFSAEEVEALHAHRAVIAKLGLAVEQMGPESLAVTAIPSMIRESSVSEALQKLGFELVQHGGSLALDKIVGDIFASMACHSVIRAGQSQSVEQMKSLLEQMDEFPLSSFCPHGRPVFVERGFHQIEREFGRIV